MLESEALTKWCPMTRAVKAAGDRNEVAPGQGAFNRLDMHNAQVGMSIANYCIGSSCMLWRQQASEPPGPDGAAHGYCGLAAS